jgi:hypothetical protein
MKTVSAAIDIDAPIAQVWAILTDLDRYREWNPLFVEASGDVATGQRVRLRTRQPNGRLMTIKPKITVARPETELRWATGLPGLVGGEHSFTLTPAPPGTRVVQIEIFKGLLISLTGQTTADNAERSFQALNEALKQRAEARAAGPTGSAS